MSELADFLLARIAKDEAAAREHQSSQEWVQEAAGWWDCDRVLAECEAKRRIVGAHPIGEADVTKFDRKLGAQPFGCTVCHEHDGIICGDGYCLTLRLLALPYADHPDYRQEWRP